MSETQLLEYKQSSEHYSETEKINACAIALGQSAREAERQTGIPNPSILRWLQNDDIKAKALQRKREQFDREIEPLFEQVAKRWLNKALEYEPGERDTIDKMTTASAIMFDKLRLLRGESTVNTDIHVSLNLTLGNTNKIE